MAILCNGIELPVNVVITIGAGDNQCISDFTAQPPLFNGVAHEKGFVIRENLNLNIGFYPDSQADVDEHCYLEIESHSDQEQQQNNFKIPLGKSVDIFNVRDGHPFPFRLGYTVMKLVYKKEVYLTKTPVIPIHYSYEQVICIHNYLEQQVSRICYDHIINKGSIEQYDNTELYWHREYGKFHHQKESEIVGLLSRISEDELSEMIKGYVAQAYPGKMDAKGLGKTLTKGAINQGNPYFNKKAQLVIDEKSSMWLKYAFYRWHHKIEDAIFTLESEVRKINGEIDKLEQKIEYNITKKYNLNNHYVSEIYARALPGKINALRQKIKQLIKYKTDRDLWLKSLYFIKHRILYVLNETELQNVLIRPPKGHVRLKGPVLKRIQRLYEESESVTKPEGNKRKIIQVPKHTWQVFEYFVVSKTIDILANLRYDFKVVQGLDNNIVENIINNGIPESATFILENDTHVVKITYDDPLPRSEEDAIENNHSFYTFSTHNRPDLRVELYQKDNDGIEKFLGLVVIEVKFRKFEALYNKSTPTNTMLTLTDYSNIMYLKGGNQYGHSTTNVDRVICVYSGNTNGNKNSEFKNGRFYIRLFPQIDDNNEIINLIGENEVKEILDKWIQQKMTVYAACNYPVQELG